METILLYLGRILFGGYFTYSGFNHFKMLDMMSGYAKSKGTPLPKLSVAFSGLLLLIGGLSVLFNILPSVGFISLALFLIPVTFIMHAFWKVQDPTAKMHEMINFMKNIALLGAVLILLAQAFA
ncbi:MAG: DoxX family protein [Ignavibacteriales bacterium]|nr:DoxX family protein [Ignavibacteriales bacterium]